MCKAAGIEGYKTNHSLRATSTSRLYQGRVEEQLVMERSGHHSVEGVRSYKRTSGGHRRALSDILNRAPKLPRTTDPLPAPLTTTPTLLPPHSIAAELPRTVFHPVASPLPPHPPPHSRHCSTLGPPTSSSAAHLTLTSSHVNSHPNQPRGASPKKERGWLRGYNCMYTARAHGDKTRVHARYLVVRKLPIRVRKICST